MIEKLQVKKSIIQDAINIINGVYAPLVGFLRQNDYQSVLDNMRLTSGQIWSIPIILDINKNDFVRLKEAKKIELVDAEGNVGAIIDDIEIYDFDKNELAEKIYGTLDKNHPGVESVMKMGDYLLGGKVVWANKNNLIFPDYHYLPAETKKIFKEKNWQTVVAFQTRNVPHQGHEFLQKEALKEADGLFIQPVVGKKKLSDFKDEYIISSYELLIDKHYPKDRVLLGVLPLEMRYAGPREALMHALIRKNFGCSHFIVGRDHAGVGNYYPPLAAQEIFNNFNPDELGIKILKFEEVVYNKSSGRHCFISQCPEEEAINFSGTKLRQGIINKEPVPEYIIRQEIYNFLAFSSNLLVDLSYRETSKDNKFVLWFTGLSGAGKTTIADRLFNILKEKKVRAERLDGDIVRESLTKDLGFSPDDRNENIKRVGLAANLLYQNGVGVLASFISPYRKQRDEIRKKIKNFIEVFVDAPLAVCEQRDRKGLYKKARSGEIKNFTGISDPYEAPENPEIHLKTDQMSVEECVEAVLRYLNNNNLL